MEAVQWSASAHRVGGLHVRRYAPAVQTGLATPILFVHGAWHGAWTYALWQSWFAAVGWASYALSLRNHPGSDPVESGAFLRLGALDYVADVAEVARWVGRPLILVGHSMGGAIVQKAAESLDLAALVLLASVKPQALGRHRSFDLPADVPFLPGPREMRPLLFDRIGDEEFEAFYARLVPESPGVMNQTGGGRLPVDSALIRCPVLAIDGEADPTVRYAEQLARFYGGYDLVVPGAGHNLMMQHSAIDVALALHGWLTDCLPGAIRRPRRSAEVAGLVS